MWILLLSKRLRGEPTDGGRKPGRLYRVVAYFGVLLLICSFFTLRSARAQVVESALQVGRDLLPIADLLGDRSQLDIDGERAWVGSAVSDEPMARILDRFAANCRENGVGENSWQNLKTQEELARVDLATFDPGVIRHENGNEGMVVCFPAGEHAKKSFVERLLEFQETLDLGSLGNVRYAFVRSFGAQSHVLSLWTGEHFRLDKLAATDEYEPGSDNPNIPRPIRSRRTISASLDGTPYGVRGYLSQGSPREVVEAYDAEMTARGFRTVEPPEQEHEARGYVKDGFMLVLGTSRTEDGKTIVSLAELGTHRTSDSAAARNAGVRIED